MKKYWIYGIALVLIVIICIMGYYAFENFTRNQLIDQQVENKKNNNMIEVPNIQLRPGESENRLDGTIVSINTSNTPATIVITPLFTFMRFSIIPHGITDRKIELRQDLLVLEGIPLAEETEEITIQDLKIGDRVVIITLESVLDIATREKYTAFTIRRIVTE